jgi:hypothetical protein
LSAGASPPSVTGTGVVALGETTGQACAAAAVDCLIADSAAHAIKASFNNGAASQVARYVDTLAVFAAGALASGTTATTQSADDNSTKVATTAYADRLHTRGIGFTLGDPTNSAALTTSYTSYVTVPFACTISAYNLLVDATDTTLRVKFWKVATGTAIPTVSNSISTSGLGVPSGTAVHSTTTSDFTSLAVTANDIVAMNVSVANTAKMVNGVLQCDQ